MGCATFSVKVRKSVLAVPSVRVWMYRKLMIEFMNPEQNNERQRKKNGAGVPSCAVLLLGETYMKSRADTLVVLIGIPASLHTCTYWWLFMVTPPPLFSIFLQDSIEDSLFTI